MNKQYNLQLDIRFKSNNNIMEFDEFDKNTSDFFIEVSRAGNIIDISKAIVTIVAIKPDNTTSAQFTSINGNRVYCDLEPGMKDIVGKYSCVATVVLGEETAIVGPLFYKINENKILRQFNKEVSTDERFTLLTDMLNRLSTIEISENSRIESETKRKEAELKREEAIEKIKNDISILISDTKNTIEQYAANKDTEINRNLEQYKSTTTKVIDDYKESKDSDITDNLNQYKTSTTEDINTYKANKNTEIDKYKEAKDLEIDNKVNKSKEDLQANINQYQTSKNKEIDDYKSAKDTLINNKIKEIDAAKTSMQDAVNSKVEEVDQAKVNMQNDVNTKLDEADTRIQELQNFESQLDHITNKNSEQDTRLGKVEDKNRTQDIYLQGLFNENAYGRLTSQVEGNVHKLEGSKSGICEVDSVVGNTMVNCLDLGSVNTSGNKDYSYYNSVDKRFVFDWSKGQSNNNWIQVDNLLSTIKANVTYTIFFNIVENNPILTDIVDTTSSADAILCNIWIKGHNAIMLRIPTNIIGVYSCTFSIKTINESLNLNRIGFVKHSMLPASQGNGILVNDGKFVVDGISILEGDYTNKPTLQEMFEGLQSSFEDSIVTQEQVDAGEESIENLGKYKCEVELVGKNLWNPNYMFIYENLEGLDIAYSRQHLKFLEIGKRYCIKIYPKTSSFKKVWINYQGNNVNGHNVLSGGHPINNLHSFIYDGTQRLGIYSEGISKKDMCARLHLDYDFYLFETPINVSSLPTYEQYFNRKETLYLNSPLLKNDVLECRNDGVYHVHNKNKYTYLGTEYIEKVANSDNGYRFSIIIKDMENETINGTNIELCNSLKVLPFDVKNKEASISSWKNQSVLYGFNDVEDVRLYLRTNNTSVIYKLAEPYEEKISDNKLGLECANGSTIEFKSVVPITSSRISYTGNIPSVKVMNNTVSYHDLDINDLIIPYCLDLDAQVSEINIVLDAVIPKTQNIKLKGMLGGLDMTYQVLKREIMRGIMTYEECINKIKIFKADNKLTNVQAEELTELAEIYLK